MEKVSYSYSELLGFAVALKEHRHFLGLSVSDFADLMGVSPSVISFIESDEFVASLIFPVLFRMTVSFLRTL